MLALAAFYWDYFWQQLAATTVHFFLNWDSWWSIVSWLGLNVWVSWQASATRQKVEGPEDPNLIYSPSLDRYVPIEMYLAEEDRVKNPLEDISVGERTWFQRTLIWLGIYI